uniref:Uncharacterized protein n=1 Tax=Knipowitschia caucasica TaxID=637954 RepID=A0AAV2LY30_KNICA
MSSTTVAPAFAKSLLRLTANNVACGGPVGRKLSSICCARGLSVPAAGDVTVAGGDGSGSRVDLRHHSHLSPRRVPDLLDTAVQA